MKTLLFILAVLVQPVMALDQGYDALSFRPTHDRSPYVSLWSSEGLPQYDYTLSMTGTYAHRPVTVKNAGVKTDFVRSQFLGHLGASFGLYKSILNIGFDAPVGLVESRETSTASFENKVVAGDVRFNLKAKIVDVRRYGVGFSVVPFMTVPTGYGKQLMGSSQVTGGGLVVLDSIVVPGIAVSLNAGARMRKSFVINGEKKSHDLFAGLGFSSLLLKNVNLTAEINTHTNLTSPFKDRDLMSVEALGGLRLQIPGTGVSFLAGGGGGILRGLDTPVYRSVFGITFHNGSASVWN